MSGRASETATPWTVRVMQFFDPARAGFMRRMLKLGAVLALMSACAVTAVSWRLAQTRTGTLTVAMVLNRTGQPHIAERLSRELIAEDPSGNVSYYKELARSLRRQGEVQAQLAVFDQAIEALPLSWVAHSQRCWYYTLYGRAAEVMPSCDYATEHVGESGYAHARRGVARATLGDLDGAATDIEEGLHRWATASIRHDPPQPWNAWLAALEAGENPFDAATLAAERERF